MGANADAAAFLPAQQQVVFEHEVGDVLEADAGFVQGQGVALGHAVDHFADGKRPGHTAGEAASLDQVAEEQREDFVRVNEVALGVYGGQAVGVAVGGEPGHAIVRADGFAQGVQVGVQRFGLRAAKERVTGAANFHRRDAVRREDFAQVAGAGAVHRVNSEAERRAVEAGSGDAVEVHQFAQVREVGGFEVNHFDAAQVGLHARQAVGSGEEALDLLHGAWRG